jgi:alcohol dehydrogenase class IV
MEYHLPYAVEGYARVAQALGVPRGSSTLEEHAGASLSVVRRMVRAAGMPALRDLGVEARNLSRLVDQVVRYKPPFSAAVAEQIVWNTLGS